jgi:rhodanese-related sulfurtransferase
MDFTARMEIDVAALKQLRDAGADIQLLDIREDWERATCLIDGSIEIAMGALPGALDRLDPDRPVVALCHHGVRSLRAASWLRHQGFAQAVSLAGGIDAWARLIDPAMARY